MAWWNKHEYPIEQVQNWVAEGKTQDWIGQQLGVSSKLIYKVCKKHGIKCQRTGPRNGSGHPNWAGGKLVDKNGYILIYCPNHPFARNPRRKYVLEHRIVMEEHLQRYLLPEEVVHHKNKVKSDNQIENLELFSRNSLHLKNELTGKIPHWTLEGHRRMIEGHQKWCENRKALKLNGSMTP